MRNTAQSVTSRLRSRVRDLVRMGRREQEEAQSIVEMALICPALVLVVLGLLWFGVTLYDYISLSQATQVALRKLVIGRGQTSDPCATAISAVAGSFASLDYTKIGGVLTINGVSYSAYNCPSASANMVIGAPVSVQLTYPARLPIPYDVISGGFTLSAKEQDKIQ